ncbi:MAG: hypothetical protein H7Y11_04260 [Armatimonadetes bacterium]|nr:hypothetical protein [Anaerolineae bacterium]
MRVYMSIEPRLMSLSLNPPLSLLAAYQKVYPTQSPSWIVQAPGRETWIAASLVSESDGYTLTSGNLNAQAKFTRRSALLKRTVTNRPIPSWARYAAGVVVLMSEAGLIVPGVMVVSSSEDTSFGPRHDHALGMAFAALWYDLCQQPYTPEQVFDWAEKARRQYVEN